MIRKAGQADRGNIIVLLRAERLPVDDLPEMLHDFWVADMDGKVAGTIGLETYGHHGLLRSMVVSPERRNKGIGDLLVKTLEDNASATGMRSVFLLTETAPEYFKSKGYVVVKRDDVPEELRASSEFSHVCPSSAILMKKELV